MQSKLVKNSDGTWESKVYKISLYIEDEAAGSSNELVGIGDLDLAKFTGTERQQCWARVKDKSYVPAKPQEVFLIGDRTKFKGAEVGFKVSVTPDESSAKPVAAAAPTPPPKMVPSSARNMNTKESAAKAII